MALTDPKDTLAYHSSRIFTMNRDMRHVPCATVANALSSFRSKDGEKDTVPEKEALWFYGMNHGMALISARRAPLEPMTEWECAFVEKYHELMAKKAVRAFYYLLWICIRESRHNQSLAKDGPQIEKLFGKPIAEFLSSIKGGETGISQAFIDHPPAATIGAFCECLAWQFYKSKWGSAYGGPKWGNIADCLNRFVSGEFSAEMMLDTVWTLSHNTSAIFNKGTFYAYHTADVLLRILDVQRSGQVPEGVLYDKGIQQFVEPSLQHMMNELVYQFPGEIGDYVDWETVEALGSVGKYPMDKEKQFAKHGLSPKAKEAAEAAAAKAKAKAEAEAKAKAEFDKTHFTVMPGLVVKKIKRAA